MLTLQLASSQFGPRMLRSFMRDRGNQIVLGTFLSTLVYCLLVLASVRGSGTSYFVPVIAVTLGMILAVCKPRNSRVCDRPVQSSSSNLRAASSDEAGFWPVTSLPSVTTKDAQSSPF